MSGADPIRGGRPARTPVPGIAAGPRPPALRSRRSGRAPRLPDRDPGAVGRRGAAVVRRDALPPDVRSGLRRAIRARMTALLLG